MDTCKGKIVGCIALLVVLTYQLLCFLAFVAFAIGFSVVASNVYEYILDAVLPSFVETFICMYLLSVFAEFHIYCQYECVGVSFASYYRTYPHILRIGTMLVYITGYGVAFTELYIQFEETHLARQPSDKDASHHRQKPLLDSVEDGRPELWTKSSAGSTKAEQWHTFFFLLSLSYIVYCTMKLIQLDVINQIRRISNQASCVHCIVTLGFMGVHIVMNILYAIPLVIVAFSVHLYECSGSMAFIQLNAVGILSGVIFAVMETRRPWPVVRSLGPFYLYENNVRAKAVLGQLQILLILIFFYRPFTKGKIMAPVTAGNNSVLCFCFFVAFTMLHYIKILVFIIVQKEEQLIPQVVVGEDLGLPVIGGDDGDDLDIGAAVIVDLDPISPGNLLGEVLCKRCKKHGCDQKQREEDVTNMNQVRDVEQGREQEDKNKDKVSEIPEEDKGPNDISKLMTDSILLTEDDVNSNVNPTG